MPWVAIMVGVSQWNPCRSRGARGLGKLGAGYGQVSVEPLPKQGCERQIPRPSSNEVSRLSGTPAEAGVRDGNETTNLRHAPSQWNPCRSVTTQVVNHGYFQMFKS